jgi:hypothetical protein
LVIAGTGADVVKIDVEAACARDVTGQCVFYRVSPRVFREDIELDVRVRVAPVSR